MNLPKSKESLKSSAFAAIAGTPPSIEWRPTDELLVDLAYQRSCEERASQSAIATIAHQWDWRLCAPLTVSRRGDPEKCYVIDGQHRLEAAKLRGDIPYLPCIISRFESLEEEARCFVAVNTARKKITALDTHRASLAAGNTSAVRIQRVIDAAGLSLAPHMNFISWRPLQITCIAGVAGALRAMGEKQVVDALTDLAAMAPDKVLRYAGTMLKGIYAVRAKPVADFDSETWRRVLASRSQEDWLQAMVKRQAQFGETQLSAIEYAMSDALVAALAG